MKRRIQGKYKKTVNLGSAVVEMTLLIPILLGVFYLYVSLFLYLIESGKDMAIMAEELYLTEEIQTENETATLVNTIKQGSTKYASVNNRIGMFEIDLQLSCYEDCAIKNIRRWQFAVDTFRTGEDESLHGNVMSKENRQRYLRCHCFGVGGYS